MAKKTINDFDEALAADLAGATDLMALRGQGRTINSGAGQVADFSGTLEDVFDVGQVNVGAYLRMSSTKTIGANVFVHIDTWGTTISDPLGFRVDSDGLVVPVGYAGTYFCGGQVPLITNLQAETDMRTKLSKNGTGYAQAIQDYDASGMRHSTGLTCYLLDTFAEGDELTIWVNWRDASTISTSQIDASFLFMYRIA